MDTKADELKKAIVSAALEVLSDKEMMKTYWRGGYEELTTHALDGSRRWIGAKLMALLGSAFVGFGLYLLGKFSK